MFLIDFVDFADHALVFSMGNAQLFNETRELLLEKNIAGKQFSFAIQWKSMNDLCKFYSNVVPFSSADWVTRNKTDCQMYAKTCLCPSKDNVLELLVNSYQSSLSMGLLATENKVQTATNHRNECLLL